MSKVEFSSNYLHAIHGSVCFLLSPPIMYDLSIIELNLTIIIKLDIWIVSQFLGSGREIVICVVWLAMLFQKIKHVNNSI